jgi:HK97 family phage major capsid protein
VSNAVLQRYVDERTQTQQNIDRILDRSNEEERDLTDSERELIVGHRARLEQLEPMIGELLDVEETREKAKDARAALTRRREAPPTPDDDDGDDGGDGDGDEGKYATFAQYARDVMLVRFDKIGATVGRSVRERAAQRLTRQVPQVLTSDIPGIVPTQYLTQIIQVIDRSRPLVDASTKVGLTSGKIQWPQITNRPEVAKQTAEKTTAGDGAMDVGMLEKVASTFISAANFSWQAINWSNPDALQLWFDLAAADYAKKTDAEAAAVLAAADTTPIAVASADLEGWMAGIAAAAGEVYANTGRYADTVAANPADGYALLGYVGSVAPTFLATGVGNLATGSFPSLGGLRFVISAGLPAGTVIVGDFDALLCAETAGSPVELRAVEPSIGGVEVGIIGAFACAIADPGAFAELTAPAGP